MQVGDFIEDTYTSFDGHIVAVTRGVVTEIFRDYVKYYCSQIVFSEHDSMLDGMLGTKVNRHERNITVLSQRRGGKVVQSG
jgi:hypothetical protein